MRYIALLRGINVGGHAKIRMPDLRDLLHALGCGDVVTYVQSGNAVVTSPASDPGRMARDIEEAITAKFGFAVSAMVRTPEEMAAVVVGNAFPSAVNEPKHLHVAFLSDTPRGDRLSTADLARLEPDRMELGEREAYLLYPNGLARSKLTNDFLEKRLGVRSTMRNWNTVTKLLALARENGAGPE